ncbi:MAG: SUMF1/EgtB/PvdO family nonheme iron enzyme [Deltaproteobacteria bacterium]|nr:SUMF1/EgtB/PvdO family nonheme iron enzyme [Deltaproteobacteria bacterium]
MSPDGKSMLDKWVLGFVSVIVLFLLCGGQGLGSQNARGIGVVLKTGSGAEAKVESIPLYDRMTAVIIGIDEYGNLGREYHLKYAVRDAKGVAETLRKYYPFEEIIELYNGQATRANILKILQGDLSSSGSDDAVLIYFACHGITRSTAQGDLGYLVPFDGSVKMDEMYKNISMQQMKSDISPLIPAKHVLFIADTCFGGLLLATRFSGLEPEHRTAYLREITREPVRQILTAGGKDQQVLDGGIGGHSVFTGRLIAALEGVQDFISARELGFKLQMEVYGDAAARGHAQKPLVGEIYGTGDFVFVPDSAKRDAREKGVVERLEAELAELERLRKSAEEQEEEARLRELERETLEKEAAVKLARLRQEAAGREAERRASMEEEARRSAAELEVREKERLERLAYLEAKAEQLRREVEKPHQVIGLAECVKEIHGINETIVLLEKDFAQERREQQERIQEEYRAKTERIAGQQVDPWDKMFETEAEYRKRLEAHQNREKGLTQERASKELEVNDRLEKDLEAQKEPLREQVRKLTERRFDVSPSRVEFQLLAYVPEQGHFELQVNLKDTGISSPDGKEWLTLSGTLPVADRSRARQFYRHPDLLVASVTLRVSEAGHIVLDRLVFLGPEKEQYETAGMDVGWIEPVTAMKFAWVPGGCYEMGCGSWTSDCDGDEQPVHEVCLDGFWMGRYEVTQGQWKKIMGSNPSYFKKDDHYPVDQVSWNDAEEFIEKLNARSSGGQYRLPTEAEWEYACRSGGKADKYSGGSDVERVAWYTSNSGNSTHPVGTKASNGLGIHDMSGNVWEWCEDWYSQHAYSKHRRDNPIFTTGGSSRVIHGGSWDNIPGSIRCADRDFYTPGIRYRYLGFRLVREP